MLILLSWRQGYTVCDLTCVPITAMHFVFSKAETVDLFFSVEVFFSESNELILITLFSIL